MVSAFLNYGIKLEIVSAENVLSGSRLCFLLKLGSCITEHILSLQTLGPAEELSGCEDRQPVHSSALFAAVSRALSL